MLNHAEGVRTTHVLLIDLTVAAFSEQKSPTAEAAANYSSHKPLNVTEARALVQAQDDACSEVVFDHPVMHVAALLADGQPPSEALNTWQDFAEELLMLHEDCWNRVLLREAQPAGTVASDEVLLLAAAQLLQTSQARRVVKELCIVAQRPEDVLSPADLAEKALEAQRAQQEKLTVLRNVCDERDKRIEYFEKKLETLRNARDKRDRQITKLRAIQASQQDRLETLQARLEGAESDRKKLLGELDKAAEHQQRDAKKIEGLRRARTTRDERIEQLQASLESAKEQNRRIKNSRSWRYTKILRQMNGTEG